MTGSIMTARRAARLLLGTALAFAPLTAFAQANDTAGPQVVAPPQIFTIMAIDVVGVSKLPAAQIEKLIYPFMGPSRTPADVEAARKAVQDAYAQAGFEATVVDVPPQPQEDFVRGLVMIRVSEAPVAEVKVSGSKHHSAELILRQLPSIKPGEPLNFKVLQSELAAANRFPDRDIVPAFDAGTVPGTINVDLEVRDSLPLHASLELNNDNSPNTVPLRLTGSASYSNLWGVGHTITVGGSIAPERKADSEAYFGSYTLPFLGSPWSLVLNGYKSNSNIAALGGTNVLGNGYQIGFQAIYRLATNRDYQAFRVGVDYKDFKQDIKLRDIVISAPIRYLPLTLGYNYSAVRDKSSLDIGLSSTLGLRVIKRINCFDPTATICTPEDQFTNREVDSTENFAHLNLDLTYTLKFGGDWVAETRLSAQYADGHLVSNEQFAIGGLTSVRGYYQSEVVGDRGYAGSFELRTPSLATRIGTFVDDLRLFAFTDYGLVSIIDPLPDTQSLFSIVSLGGGLRAKLFGHLSAQAVISIPLSATTETASGDQRITFSVKGEF